MAGYEKGLKVIRSQTKAERSFGTVLGGARIIDESCLVQPQSNHAGPQSGETRCCSALNLVPYWHYVRDILTSQIQDARGNGSLKLF